MRLIKDLQEFIEGLTIGQGRRAGEKFTLLPWQKRFLRGAFGQDDDASLTIARGNGKSTFIAAIGWAAVVGPLAEPFSEVVVVASSFLQAKIIFYHALHFADPWLAVGRDVWRIGDSQNAAFMVHKPSKITFRCIASDPRRMHGIAPKLILGDELAQWEPNKIDRALAALETSRGKVPDSKALWLGTRADSPDHPFEQILRSKLGYSQAHFADKRAAPFQRRTWRKANPSLDHLPDLEKVIRREAAAAKEDPSKLASFKALRLNMGVSDVMESVLLDVETWLEIETDGEPERAGPYVLGLDLGQNAAMSAASAFYPTTGNLESLAVFPQYPDLAERGRADGVGQLYQHCYRRGELMLEGHRVADVAGLMGHVLDRWGKPAAIVVDRWREAELRQTLESISFPMTALIIRGMGFKDGAEDVRGFRSACLRGLVAPQKSLLLRSAMEGARVTTDPAGNPKLAKGGEGRRVRHRDDAAAAAMLAVAEGERRIKAQQSISKVRHVVI